MMNEILGGLLGMCFGCIDYGSLLCPRHSPYSPEPRAGLLKQAGVSIIEGEYEVVTEEKALPELEGK